MRVEVHLQGNTLPLEIAGVFRQAWEDGCLVLSRCDRNGDQPVLGTAQVHMIPTGQIRHIVMTEEREQELLKVQPPEAVDVEESANG